MRSSQKSPKEIEVRTGNVTLRVALLIITLTIAAVSLSYGFIQLLNRQTGWQQVEITSDQVNCSGDFTLNYYFGSAGVSASAEYRQVSALYSTACEEGYRYFYREGELSSLEPGKETTVSAPLYEALEDVQKAGNRCLYLAPVYDEYDRIFLCESEGEAARYDPARNSELAAHVSELAAYCNDPAMIDLELLGDNTVRLVVSDKYLSYAEENEITEFLDFGWMKNAFIIDHIADTLADGGYTLGYVASHDGFTRNLDGSGQKYSLNIFDRQDNLINMPAVMEYDGPMSIVTLRNYPMTEADKWHYFVFSDGAVATTMADPADGMSKSAVSDLVSYSHDAGCAGILLGITPVYLSDALDEERLNALAVNGIMSVWCEGNELLHNEEALSLTLNDGETVYTKRYIAP